jgi:leucyl aminopeptidase (aminopeptidase T)
MSNVPHSVRVSEVAHAAGISVLTALQLREGERFVVMHDADSKTPASALVAFARAVRSEVRAIDLSRLGARPLSALPDWVSAELSRAHASVFIASAPHEELSMRQQILFLVGQHSLRHAHMPGISALAFARGQRIDYQRVAVAGVRLLAKLTGARQLQVQSPAGTELRVQMPDAGAWYPQLGRLVPGRWGNLPAGALYASPARVDGVYVADACLGEYFGAREGSLAKRPVRLHIEDSRVTAVHAAHSAVLEREISAILSFAENSDRIGLIAVGVNYGVAEATGEALVDQNLPGLHLAIGDPAAKVTGANWSARTSFAACGAHSTVLLDGVPIVTGGKLLTPT